jgi:lysozyme family protein/peptidoglycan hydrolase-like protein with peptidoglycan-binding domain
MGTPTLAQMRPYYTKHWAAMTIQSKRRLALAGVVAKIVSGRARYEAVEKETGVPWWFIGNCHMRESSCNFATYLGNGEPISRKTRLVPAGRGPFATWEEGAIDALRFQGYAGLTDWDLATALFRFEAYNGWGYFYKGVNSPYVWGWTNEQQPGKYIADRRWSATAVDPQPGCAAMLRALIDAGHVFAAAVQAPEVAHDGTTVAGSETPAPAPTSPPVEDDPIVLHVGSRGDAVRILQGKLRDLGYPVGAIDGAYGDATADAVSLFQRRNGIVGDPEQWRRSYYDVLARADSIVSDNRQGTTPADLEQSGDTLSKVYRSARNMVMWVAGLFGITIGGGETITGTLTQTHEAANQMNSIVSWMHGNAWIALIVVGVAFAAIFEFARLHRANEYASGAYQGPTPKAEG